MTAERNRAWRIPAALFVACLTLYHANGGPIADTQIEAHARHALGLDDASGTSPAR